MKPLTVICDCPSGSRWETTLRLLTGSELVEDVFLVGPGNVDLSLPKTRLIQGRSFREGTTLNRILEAVNTPCLVFLRGAKVLSIESEALTRLIATAEKERAGAVYSDFYDVSGEGRTLHPLIDYQLGSVRDDFDFGGTILFATGAVRAALQKYGSIPEVDHAGFYDLRLKVSEEFPIHHLAEPLYSVDGHNGEPDDGRLFAYVDPKNATVQKEMEAVFTDHLKKIGAYIPAETLKRVNRGDHPYPVEASVVIPVKNRRGTIGDAVVSALSQKTDFPFNVIVVDNRSTDGTTEVLAGLAAKNPSVHHVIPARTDLGIGGCWNEAVHSAPCGRYAVQLDSDDLYIDSGTLQRMVDTLRDGQYAMVIGSYTLVNSRMEEIPPGLVDHREWTDANGHNNALRVNGLGAPRAFDTSVIRCIGFPNVSYGEDYAAVLRICREYKIGRIYDSLYLCRRWEGNTDARLSIEEANRHDAFKDSIRSKEIRARKAMNRGANQ